MSFNSFQFFAFLGASLLIFWLLPRKLRLGFLLAASYIFYATTDWRFLALIVVSTAVDYVVGITLDATDVERQRRVLITTSVVVNLAILATFKYFNFFADSFASVADAIGLDAPRWALQVLLPVGLSFYTFQSMSYAIDVYRRDIPAERSPLVVATYVAFFPQLLAGPIERANKLMPQLQDLPQRISGSRVLEAVELIVIGLFKKVAVADVAFRVVVDGFAPEQFTDIAPGKGWQLTSLAMLAFGMQQYCDFSGYSDMARGVAKLFGVELSRNFLRPKQSRSFAEFWQRWHVTFMRWMRDYVFRPLQARGPGPAGTAVNALIVFGLAGLWHGARWPAVVWGMALGALLAAEVAISSQRRQTLARSGASRKIELGGPAKRGFRWGPVLVLGTLLISLPLQVLPDWSSTQSFYANLTRSGPTPWHHVIAVVYAMVCIAAIDRHQKIFEDDEDRRRLAQRHTGGSAGEAALTADATDLAVVGTWQWQARTAAMIMAVVLFGSNAVAAEFYYFQF